MRAILPKRRCLHPDRTSGPAMLVPLAALILGAAPPTPARLAEAKRAATAAEARAAALGREAAGERRAAARAAADERAARARVAAAAARLDAAATRAQLVDARLRAQRAELGRRQAPAARLLAGLQGLARRPAIAAVAQPGSVADLVRLRAALRSVLPVVRARAAAVEADLLATRRLRAGAALAAAELRARRGRLEGERTALARMEADHRARARALGRDALSESDRALALGERARDLIDQLGTEGRAAATADDLARLPGPLPRPDAARAAPSPAAYRMPVAGRLVTGFGEVSRAGVRSRGISLRVAPGAVVVAPAAGEVRYAARFRGFGVVVILDHGDGWSTTVTGLARTPLARGARVGAARPLGRAGRGEPEVTVELRRRGRAMDLLALAG